MLISGPLEHIRYRVRYFSVSLMVVQLGQIPVLCNILVATLLADNPLSRNAGEFKPLNAILG